MTEREILDKAFDKAKGYKGVWIQLNNIYDSLPINGIIFSHSFAKTFWGEEKWKDNKWLDNDHWLPVGDDLHGVEQGFSGYAWQYHLQQMVLEENPIKYLEKFL